MAELIGGFGVVGGHSGTRNIAVRIETACGTAMTVVGSRFAPRKEVLEGRFEGIGGIGISRREHEVLQID